MKNNKNRFRFARTDKGYIIWYAFFIVWFMLLTFYEIMIAFITFPVCIVLIHRIVKLYEKSNHTQINI